MLLLNRVHVFAIFVFDLDREHGSEQVHGDTEVWTLGAARKMRPCNSCAVESFKF